MRKIYIIFTLCLLTALGARPDTITLKWDGNNQSADASTALATDNIFGSSAKYSGDSDVATALTVSKIYVAKNNYGLKFGTSSVSGTLEFELASSIKPTKITITARQYGNTEKYILLYLNDASSANKSFTLTSSLTTYDYVMDGNTQLSKLKIGTDGSYRAYLQSIVITYAGTTKTVETPSFSLVSGDYYSTQDVTITSATSGATIYYTTDGSTPTTSSAALSNGGTVTINSSCTLNAIAVKDGMNNSDVASATYNIFLDKYVLLTDASKLKDGSKIIIATSATAGSAYAISNALENYYRHRTPITILQGGSEAYLYIDDNVEVFELEKHDNYWALKATSSNYAGKYLSTYASIQYNDLLYRNSLDNEDLSLAEIIANNTNYQTVVRFKTEQYPRYVRYNSSEKNAFVCYAETGSTKPVYVYRLDEPEALTVVTGIDEFKAVEQGSKVRLYLPDDYNARVLHVKSNADGTTDAYVRDDHGGAMLMQGISPNRPMACNQHLAGYINGTYSTNADGVPLFVPDDGLTNTAFLVIADPVTELQVEPKEITASEIGENLADWVTVSDIETSQNAVKLNNALTAYAAPYAGSIVDVSAIAAATGTLYPISENDVPIITYVVDSEKDFVSPPSNIAGTAVRVKRSLAAGIWTPLTLPFDYYDFDGEVMEYSSFAQGDPVQGSESNRWFAAGNMYFTSSNVIKAGVPYLVRPGDEYSEFVATDVTLSRAAASAVTFTIGGKKAPAQVGTIDADDEYSFVGVYSPTTLAANAGYKVMTADGNIVWASDVTDPTVTGTAAYFVTPADQGLRVMLGEDGSNVGVITGIADVMSHAQQTAPTGIYNIMGEKMPDDWQQLPPGFYIVNGVKTIKR